MSHNLKNRTPDKGRTVCDLNYDDSYEAQKSAVLDLFE